MELSVADGEGTLKLDDIFISRVVYNIYICRVFTQAIATVFFCCGLLPRSALGFKTLAIHCESLLRVLLGTPQGIPRSLKSPS